MKPNTYQNIIKIRNKRKPKYRNNNVKQKPKENPNKIKRKPKEHQQNIRR